MDLDSCAFAFIQVSAQFFWGWIGPTPLKLHMDLCPFKCHANIFSECCFFTSQIFSVNERGNALFGMAQMWLLSVMIFIIYSLQSSSFEIFSPNTLLKQIFQFEKPTHPPIIPLIKFSLWSIFGSSWICISAASQRVENVLLTAAQTGANKQRHAYSCEQHGNIKEIFKTNIKEIFLKIPTRTNKNRHSYSSTSCEHHENI